MTTNQQPTFGEALRRCRVAAGLTQAALAERAGLSTRGVQDLERGVRLAPYADTLQRLAEALCLTEADRAALQAAGRRPPRSAAAVSATRALPTGTVTFLFTDIVGSTSA